MDKPALFKCLVVASKAKDHLPMIASAEPFFAQMAAENHFAVDFTDDAGTIYEENLGSCQVFVMLHLAPFDMTSPQQGGWIGFHHASLLGEFDGYPLWQWYSEFLGDITYSNYIPTFAEGTVNVEDARHPIMRSAGGRVRARQGTRGLRRGPGDPRACP